jgi:hypothetical protein
LPSKLFVCGGWGFPLAQYVCQFFDQCALFRTPDIFNPTGIAFFSDIFFFTGFFCKKQIQEAKRVLGSVIFREHQRDQEELSSCLSTSFPISTPFFFLFFFSFHYSDGSNGRQDIEKVDLAVAQLPLQRFAAASPSTLVAICGILLSAGSSPQSCTSDSLDAMPYDRTDIGELKNGISGQRNRPSQYLSWYLVECSGRFLVVTLRFT